MSAIIIASILLTLAVGLEVNGTAIRQAIRFRARILLLWVLQVLLPPVIALLIVRMLNLPLHVAAGLLLLAEDTPPPRLRHTGGFVTRRSAH